MYKRQHFAPRHLLDAIALYRKLFRPSASLTKPYVIVGVPLIAAPTDEEADYLASSTFQRVLGILHGDRQRLQPPVHNYLAGLHPQEMCIRDRCWHTSDWTPARAVEPCDALIRPVAAATPTPSAAAVTPTPTPAPALSAPAPNAVALMPVPQKISLSSDALFSFDKFVLRPEGQAKLDDLVHQLDGAVYDSVLVTGHTDRLGSNAYNQKLSDRRAQAVKGYLCLLYTSRCV